MKLVLSRVEAQDLDAIVPLLFEAFSGLDILTVFCGRKSSDAYERAKHQFQEAMLTDPTDFWVKVEDVEAEDAVEAPNDADSQNGTRQTRRIVCAGNWKIVQNYIHSEGELPVIDKDYFTYLETEDQRRDAAPIFNEFLARRVQTYREPHVLCHLLFTDPAYQGKGAGRLVMQWGNDVADSLMLPCWLESTAAGESLYTQMGYEGQERVKMENESFSVEFFIMRRPVTKRILAVAPKTPTETMATAML